MAALRAAGANERALADPCEDPLRPALRRVREPRCLARLRRTSCSSRSCELRAPGSYCFTIARTRHFDEALLAELPDGRRAGGACSAPAMTSRAFRFAGAARGVTVFELDHPGTQARKRQLLDEAAPRSAGQRHASCRSISPREFRRTRCREHGFVRSRRTLFLWEGVSYYLPRGGRCRACSSFVAACAPGSSIVFDYAMRSFVDGDTAPTAASRSRAGSKKIGEPFLFGLDAAETDGLPGGAPTACWSPISDPRTWSRSICAHAGRHARAPRSATCAWRSPAVASLS